MVNFLQSKSFLPHSYTRAGWAACSKADKSGRDLLLRAKMMELFEYVFFTLWLTLWLSQDVQSLLCYKRLQPWILATFCISAILIKFPCGLRNEAMKFVYKQDNFVYEQGNRRYTNIIQTSAVFCSLEIPLERLLNLIIDV